jgi:hypothetical protein
MEKDQKDIQQYNPEYVQELWVGMLNNSIKVRRMLFKNIFSGEPKEDIEEAIKDWETLSELEKMEWVHNTLTGGKNANYFIDLVLTLKTYKNPKKALKIWKENNNL